MFVYCGNNPVTQFDPTGSMFVGILSGNPEAGCIGAGGGGITYSIPDPSPTPSDIFKVPTPGTKDEVWARSESDLADIAVIVGLLLNLYTYAGLLGLVVIPRAVDLLLGTIGIVSEIWGAGVHFKIW